MTGSQTNTQGSSTRPISVAELLARNGTIGAPPVTGRRRRRRGKSHAVTVAELTGEIPVVTDEERPKEPDSRATPERPANGATKIAEPVAEPLPDEPEEDRAKTPYWSEPEARWPESPPQRRKSGPEPSEYPRPLPGADRTDAEPPGRAEPRSGAERMSPDPLDDYSDIPVDVMDTEVREAEPATDDSAYVRSYLGDAGEELSGEAVAGEVARRAPSEERTESGPEALPDDEEPNENYLDFDDDVDTDVERDVDESVAWSSRTEMLLHGGLVVLQSILAVAFGAGLFISFEQLWQWNNIVALVLAVLVILGLVAAVQVVRKTVDTASTLIAVAVGALIAFGPLVLLQSG
jgi:hypothetical protein